ncbi:MAG TPA: metalloregulator ArsR/SmtB family transcription factor [Steroidobacteraceae bacterium]|nr:metalloregulator ArsR/SmtB family transcription factor [Steroidobacteraceae bacterium]
MAPRLRVVSPAADAAGDEVIAEDERLSVVFAALSDPVRRRILQQLDGQALLVSELAAPFDISLQAVSRHIQVLVRAGLVQQERSGRISRCSLDVGPLFEAAVWLNRYTKYWQGQFDLLAATLVDLDEQRASQDSGSAGHEAPAGSAAGRPAASPGSATGIGRTARRAHPRRRK